MVKIDVEKTELVWPGKYDENGKLKEVDRISLPFQIIETVNTSRTEREKRKKVGRSLYDFFEPEEGETVEEGWKNKLIWGDNKLVMGSLLKKFAGKIDLIYIDPPFATGADFKYTTEIGESGERTIKEQSIIEEKAYRDTWGKGLNSYLQMLYDRLYIMRDLLSEKGQIFVHCDWHVGHFIKLIMDEIFGKENFRNEIIWHYRRWTAGEKTYQKMHDTIFWYTKSDSYFFNLPYEPYGDWIKKDYQYIDENTGKRWRWHTVKGKRYKVYLEDENKGVKCNDVWQIPYIVSTANERVGYATQKPEALLSRIIKFNTEESDLIADFFCGSGTTLAVAEKLGRRWIGCDLSRWAIHVTRKRLLEIENCKPFEILNLGKYERQYWQDISFGNKKEDGNETIVFQYIAFILKLYGAEPVSGTNYIHGKKGQAMVHVGAVDSPVTIDEINLCIDECLSLKQKELHILGWEWEMGLNELMVKEAKSKGIKLILLNIPREVMDPQAVEKGDVRFFELAYLDADIKKIDKRKIKVILKDFAMPDMDTIPEDVREKVKKWSDYIDYWAVDWDFRNDTFVNGWVTYRTKKNRKLELESDVHRYDKPGKYTILVKVVDIFGNDTSVAYDVKVE